MLGISRLFSNIFPLFFVPRIRIDDLLVEIFLLSMGGGGDVVEMSVHVFMSQQGRVTWPLVTRSPRSATT